MADLSTVDLASVIERLTGAIRFGKEQSRGDKRTRKGGPCPFCGLGKDRFAVFVNDTPQHYYCGIHGTGCGAWGDAITFVRHYLDKDYWEACEILDVGPDSTYTGPRRKKGVDEDIPPSEQWQEKAVAFCQEAKEMLHSSQWQDAMKWLTNERGLTEAMIDVYGLGFNPETRNDDPAQWGLSRPENETVWIPRGFVLPYRVGGSVWKVSIRRTNKDLKKIQTWYEKEGRIDKPAKYIEISGSSQCLYGVNEIRPGEPTVIVEGPLDKLIFTQVVGRRIPCIATGSTGHCKGHRWVQEIQQASRVLVAFDYDENQAGSNAAKEWRDLVQGAKRLTPWAHDINDMYLQGFDLNAWVDVGMELLADDPLNEALTFYQQFCSQDGYYLRLREDGLTIAIGVPEELSDAEFEAIRAQVDARAEALREVLREKLAV